MPLAFLTSILSSFSLYKQTLDGDLYGVYLTKGIFISYIYKILIIKKLKPNMVNYSNGRKREDRTIDN